VGPPTFDGRNATHPMLSVLRTYWRLPLAGCRTRAFCTRTRTSCDWPSPAKDRTHSLPLSLLARTVWTYRPGSTPALSTSLPLRGDRLRAFRYQHFAVRADSRRPTGPRQGARTLGLRAVRRRVIRR
jgi:hypothetical protein